MLAKQEINCLLETLQKQQHQFTELADHIQLDAGIPVTFTKVRSVPEYLIEGCFCKRIHVHLGFFSQHLTDGNKPA